jgi:hypothetical protein
MRANRTEYLFSVNTHTPSTMTVDSGEEFTVQVRGAFDDVAPMRSSPPAFRWSSFPPQSCEGSVETAPEPGPRAGRCADPVGASQRH